MKELIILIVVSALAFLLFLITLILSLTKKNKKLRMMSVFFFIAFTGFSIWAGFTFVSKTYNKVSETFKPRTGEEIYEALFDKRQTECVKILNYKDQIIPKIDYAIWLHFESCPNELKRILSKHEFTSVKLSADKWDGKIPGGETLDWFNPKTLGDTIVVYEYSTNNSKKIQTIWSNSDSTKVYVRDILD